MSLLTFSCLSLRHSIGKWTDAMCVTGQSKARYYSSHRRGDIRPLNHTSETKSKKPKWLLQQTELRVTGSQLNNVPYPWPERMPVDRIPHHALHARLTGKETGRRRLEDYAGYQYEWGLGVYWVSIVLPSTEYKVLRFCSAESEYQVLSLSTKYRVFTNCCCALKPKVENCCFMLVYF